jgi:rubrerythrin
MSPRLHLHPLAERHSRQRRPTRRAASIHKREVEPTTSATQSASTPQPASTQEHRDIAVERVRAAGGPLDQASYICQCGYLFAAPVSTTVACPHCGTPQAW